MRKTLLLLLMTAMVITASAVRPLHSTRTVTQSDGTTLTVLRNGNRHLAFYTTQDGLVLKKNANGDFVYAQKTTTGMKATNVLAHDAGQRTAEEKAFVKGSNLKNLAPAMSRALKAKQSPARKEIGASTADGLGKFGQSGMGAVNSIGEYTIPVIMVQYADQKFLSGTTKEKMLRYYNKEGYDEEDDCVGSVRDYFKDQSRGMFVPTFDIVAVVTLDQGFKHYGENVTIEYEYDEQTYEYEVDAGLNEDNYFISEAIEKAIAEGADFTKYEVDGAVPLVAIFYAGEGEATSSADNAEDFIWPCELDVDADFSGVHFNSYFVGNEVYYDGTLMGMGVFCHEFGHALGLPDFYWQGYDSSPSSAPFGEWSIMDYGSYVKDAQAPISYTAYERSYMGWLDIKELTEAGDYTLAPYDSEEEDATPAMMIRNPNNDSEYFILENHQEGKWNPSYMGSGLKVTVFKYVEEDWMNNYPNWTTSEYDAKLQTANGGWAQYSEGAASAKQLYGNGTNNITKWSFLSGSSLSGKPVKNVMVNDDGTISFTFIRSADEPEPEPAEGAFQKISSQSDLEAGKHYIIVYEGSEDEAKVYAGVKDNNYGNVETIDIVDGTISIDGTEAMVVTLEAVGSNWALKTDDGYIAYTSTAAKKNNNLWLVDAASTDGAAWKISVADEYIQSAFNTDRYLQYNTSSPRFAGYLLSSKQQDVVLYKEIEKPAPTGISSTKTNRSSSVVYDLSGRRVSNADKGVFIVNGKKIVR